MSAAHNHDSHAMQGSLASAAVGHDSAAAHHAEHLEAARRLALLMTGSDGIAEDAARHALIETLRAKPDMHWAPRIRLLLAVRAALARSPETTAPPDPLMAASRIDGDSRAAVGAFSSLPVPIQTALWHHYVEHESSHVLATALGVAVQDLPNILRAAEDKLERAFLARCRSARRHNSREILASDGLAALLDECGDADTVEYPSLLLISVMRSVLRSTVEPNLAPFYSPGLFAATRPEIRAERPYASRVDCSRRWVADEVPRRKTAGVAIAACLAASIATGVAIAGITTVLHTNSITPAPFLGLIDTPLVSTTATTTITPTVSLLSTPVNTPSVQQVIGTSTAPTTTSTTSQSPLPAVVSLGSAAAGTPLIAGGHGDLTFTVMNQGAQPVTDVAVRFITLGASWTASSGSAGNGWTCVSSANSAICRNSELAPRTQHRLTLPVAVGAHSTVLTVVAELSANGSLVHDSQATIPVAH